MQMYISEEAMVADMQDKFQTLYPFLKLEFFSKPHPEGGYSPEEEKIPPETRVEEMGMRRSFGWIDISYYRTAAEVEHDFSHIFGLNAQIFRKAGTLWLETTKTDNWTLEELNNAGRSAKSHTFQLPDAPDNDTE
ncbi:hypothetical protein HGH92_03275 [Chitinophaga varians]|uniref:Uncharacterized protein n=1 Tax=Chitinophaga varians TaxID=2202339 RepID=A0A847RR78_9BACT|nr:hypothetical protein [Chitinophaga varians]NLR63317.1 hypothetical protein [Chitinophaga varians]